MTPDERQEFSIGSDGQEHRGSCRIFYAENRCTCRGPAVTPDEPGRAGRFWRALADTVRWMIRAEEGRSEWESRNR